MLILGCLNEERMCERNLNCRSEEADNPESAPFLPLMSVRRALMLLRGLVERYHYEQFVLPGVRPTESNLIFMFW